MNTNNTPLSAEQEKIEKLQEENNGDVGYHCDDCAEVVKSFLLASNQRVRLQTLQEVQGERCNQCSTNRKKANDGTRYLCNHFSEFCNECEEWALATPLAAKLSALIEQER